MNQGSDRACVLYVYSLPSLLNIVLDLMSYLRLCLVFFVLANNRFELVNMKQNMSNDSIKFIECLLCILLIYIYIVNSLCKYVGMYACVGYLTIEEYSINILRLIYAYMCCKLLLARTKLCNCNVNNNLNFLYMLAMNLHPIFLT